jgi:hypothetical protein
MAGTPSSSWSTQITQGANGPQAAFLVSKSGGSPQPFVAKGMCYSPCPIGGSNAYGPAIGDWFWDTFDAGGTTITSWQGVWSNDLPNIQALGVNLIRVYCMLATQLPPASQSQVFTHTAFLDACQAAGIYVLVGIPLPPNLFWLGQSVQPSTTWWTDVLQATVAQMADHPAVMGFTIGNECDNGAVSTYGPPAQAQYWWGQVQAMAQIVKTAAPTKLVGIANHDDPGICKNCQTYMASCTAIDFWGVNTYQPQSFESVFGNTVNYPTGYSTLTGAALKPVLLTEYGFPATSRPDALDPTGIYSDATTQGRTAAVLQTMIPLAYQEPMNTGICYFEYCDEYWNQSGYNIPAGLTCPAATAPDIPVVGDGGNFQPPNITTPYGGPVACGFPNYYWDNDGFGIYAVAVGQGRNPADPWNGAANGPATPLDQRMVRQPIFDAITGGW